jgi:RHS repeat-associated protein
LSLLGIAQESAKPDIASGVRTNLSYVQVNNNSNPFHYDSTPLTLTLPDGTVDRITNQTNKTAAATKLDLALDNTGAFAAGVPGDDYVVNGHVTVGANTYDGVLLKAEVVGFGFADSFSKASGEFDVRLVVTGGALAQANGPYSVGDGLGVLIHQPGLTITQFPATFTFSSQASGLFTGSSDSLKLRAQLFRLIRVPMTPVQRPPTNDAYQGVPSTSNPSDCGCNPSAPSSGPASSSSTQDTGDSSTALYDGAPTQQVTDLSVPGRGVDWSVIRTYRGDTSVDGPLGRGWELVQNQRMEVVTTGNIGMFTTAYPSVKVGDVLRIDGGNRDDLYVLNPGGSYTSPSGFYTNLVLNPDGSYVERYSDGVVWTYHKPDAQGIATPTSETDRDGNFTRFVYDDSEELIFQYDSLGRPIQYTYDAESHLSKVTDYFGRTIQYSYDANGNLATVTTPAVTGTPTGNDFPSGKTTRYTYDANHRLLTVTAPNEVADGGPPRLTYTYDASGRVTTLQDGGTNNSNVPSGGTITYQYNTLGSAPPGDTSTPVRQTTVTDRNGNQTVYQYNQFNNTIDVKEFANRGVRSGDPAFFESRYSYDTNYRLTQHTYPQGNTVVYTYDAANPDRFQQGNLLSETQTPDAARGGDQSAITTTYTYEPIYNQIHTVTEPRGNDPSYVPQNGGSSSASRYTTTYTYDYQEGTNFVGLGATLGISPAAAAARLAAAGVPMGLGDVNADGRTNQIGGNLIRVQSPPVNLLPGSNEAAVEGTTLQPVVTTYAYNDFGQITMMVDPEQNVTTYTYYPARDPNGDGIVDNPAGNTTTGGYLKQTTVDSASNPSRDSGSNPTPTSIRTVYMYDAVGNKTREIDGRGIATDYVYNQLNQVVQVVQASAHGLLAADPTEPIALTDFRYVERFFYDANNNLVLSQVEDRGNTSNVDGNPPAADLPVYAPNPDPVGGAAFVDTVYKYDILDHRVETVQEVSNGASPEFLHTRYRYDPNGNQVLTILPEGNANSTIYDERDLVFESSRGETDLPPLTLLSPTDPTTYDVRGGETCQCVHYRYDANGNVIETVNDDDSDLSSANNDPTLGPGDRTRYIYDGYDRRTSVVDSVGDQAVYQYDPAGNVIRTSQFGPTGGPSPTSDGPAILAQPVSSLGAIQSSNLVNSNLLAATETSYDELSRPYQTSRVLFVNTIPTTRAPDVAEGAGDVGKGNLTPGQTQAIPGVSGVTILGRVSTRTEYDRDSRMVFQVQDDLDTSRAIYDGANRVIKTIDPEGNTVETAYDDDSNVIEKRETDVSQVPGVPNEVFLTTNFYDGLNRLQETVDNLGRTTDYRYDSRNNLVATADASGPVGPAIARRAFTSGSLTVNTTNQFGNVTQYFYDGLSRRIRDEQVLTSSGQGDGVHIGATLEGVKTATPTPDASQGGGDGIIRTGYNYDKNSLLSSQIDDQGNVTLYLYDNVNRKITETDGLTVNSTPLNNAKILGTRVVPTPTAATINNPGVIPSSQIDAQLSEAKTRIDAVASLFPSLADSVDDHPPTTVVWGYSPDGLVLIQQDQNGSETFTKYDAIHRPIAVRVFRAGQSDSFAGDPVFAPAPGPIPTNPSTSFPAVQGTTIQDYQYDGLSRMTRSTDNNDPTTAADDSVVTDAYDSLGRIIEETQTFGASPTQAVSSAWRAENLRIKLTYPNDRPELYTYDHLDRLATVADQGAALPIAQYHYIGVDRVLERLYPINGTRETYLNDAGTADVGYDGLRRPVQERELRTDNSIVVGFTYTYDRMDDKLTAGKLHDAANSETYAYDSAYRLISFHRAAGGVAPSQSTWTLDGVGNWKQVDGETRQHSSFNEITVRSPGGPATSILSDDNGNEFDDGTYLFTWDYHNRLRTVTRKSDDALIAVYSYDAAGRRISKVVTNSGSLNGSTVFYLDDGREIEERDAANALLQQYVYGSYIDEPLVLDRNLDANSVANDAGDQRLFYNQDVQFSVYALTSATGAVVEGYLYDAYGRPTVYAPGPNGVVNFGGDDVVAANGASQVANSYEFTGRRFDGETNLEYFRARYYNTDQGRFISRDPLATVNGMNQYEYAMSRPTVFDDPSGMVIEVCCDPVKPTVIGGMVIGGIVAGPPGAVVGGAVGSLPQHCWVNVRCAGKLMISAQLHPHAGSVLRWFPPSLTPIVVGVPQLTPLRPGTNCKPCTGPKCEQKENCEAELACVKAQAAAYPLGWYNPIGSNSNTFAATVARACCPKPLPAGIPPLGRGRIAPGWNSAPPAPVRGRLRWI